MQFFLVEILLSTIAKSFSFLTDCRYHDGHSFSTRDRDNDGAVHTNCAHEWRSGWWYTECSHVDLQTRVHEEMGLRTRDGAHALNVQWNGVAQGGAAEEDSLQFVEMALYLLKDAVSYFHIWIRHLGNSMYYLDASSFTRIHLLLLVQSTQAYLPSVSTAGFHLQCACITLRDM